MPTATEVLADFIAGTAYSDVPPYVRHVAKIHLIDTLGCGLAAHGMSESDFAAAVFGKSRGVASAIGQDEPLDPADAAAVNGILFHSLDFDDTHPGSVVHVSSAVVAATLAEAEHLGVAGEHLTLALVIGNEVSTLLGEVAGGRFHARGFHPTGVCGIFGAVAAVSVIRNLTARDTVNAMGIAGSMASGLLEFLADGSVAKRLHPGLAARNAITAVNLATHGATGPASVLEGARGFFAAYLHGETVTLEDSLRELGAHWRTREIAIKPYSACHYTHAPVDSLASLMSSAGLESSDVERITAISDTTGAALVLAPLDLKTAPRTAYDAKFSLPYCLAHQLLRGHLDVTSFNEERIRDPEILALSRLVDAEVKTYAPSPDAFSGGVRVHTVDGRVLEAELRYQRGSLENPMTDDEVIHKFSTNARLALDRQDLDDLVAAALSLDDQDDSQWVGLLRRASSQTQTAQRPPLREV